MAESHIDFYRRWHEQSKPYIRWQLEQFEPYIGRRVADVGCGLGNFAGLLLDKDRYVGLDLDTELLAELAHRYGQSPGVRTLWMGADNPAMVQALRDHDVDTIICANVIEHIENDRQVVANMIAALPPGGHLCLLVPALPVLFGTLDTLDGHFRRYTRGSLLATCEGQSATLVRAYYFNWIGILGWFLKGRVLKQSAHTNSNYAVMNAVLPVVRGMERLVSPPLGMSVIAILRKE